VIATFADGTTAHSNLLIGADGIRSTVRRIIDPHAPAARYVPVLNLGGEIPDFPVTSLHRPVDEFQMMFGRRCFFGITPTPTGGAVWFANPPQPPRARARRTRPDHARAVADTPRRPAGRRPRTGRRPDPASRPARHARDPAAVDHLRPAQRPDLAPRPARHHRRRRPRHRPFRRSRRGALPRGRRHHRAMPTRPARPPDSLRHVRATAPRARREDRRERQPRQHQQGRRTRRPHSPRRRPADRLPPAEQERQRRHPLDHQPPRRLGHGPAHRGVRPLGRTPSRAGECSVSRRQHDGQLGKEVPQTILGGTAMIDPSEPLACSCPHAAGMMRRCRRGGRTRSI
jgi:hypothetical protein